MYRILVNKLKGKTYKPRLRDNTKVDHCWFWTITTSVSALLQPAVNTYTSQVIMHKWNLGKKPDMLVSCIGTNENSLLKLLFYL